MRYTVSGIPPALACSAFLPNLTRKAATGYQSYKYAVQGQPGTRAIPVPTRDTVPSPDAGDIAQMGYARSSDAPDAIWPGQYYQSFAIEWPGAGMPVRIYDPVMPGPTTLLPVPAVDYRARYQQESARLAVRPADRGQRQIRARRGLRRWRSAGE